MAVAFVTGGTGFLGAHLTRALVEGGDEVFALVRHKEGRLRGLAGRIEFVEGDLLVEGWESRLPARLDRIFHLAGVSSPPESIRDPARCCRINIEGTRRILDLARERGLPRVILASSSYVYGDPVRLPSREEDCLRPLTPLGASKAAVEHLGRCYHACFDLSVVALRIFTAYGPDGDPTKFVPSLIVQLMRDQRLELGDPAPTRDYVFVEDVIRALLRAGAFGEGFNVFNVGTGQETAVRDLVALLLELAGRPDVPVAYHTREPRADERRGPSRQCADIRRARDELGWEPRTPLRAGLRALLADPAGTRAHGA